jgi:DNA-binding response OmpR family regulator
MAARILIVDEDMQAWGTIAEFFAPKGYTVIAVPRAGAAIPCVPLDDLACVFLAAQALDRDGRMLLWRLRHSHPHSSVVLMITEPSSRRRSDARLPGAHGWVQKPISPRMLEVCLAEMLPSPVSTWRLADVGSAARQIHERRPGVAR